MRAYTVLDEVTLEVNTDYIAFNSITQVHDHLLLRFLVKSTESATATATDYLLLYLNGDTTQANYRTTYMSVGNVFGVANWNAGIISSLPCMRNTYNDVWSPASGYALFPYYTLTSGDVYKAWNCYTGETRLYNNGFVITAGNWAGVWNQINTAITDIYIRPFRNYQLKAKTWIQLVGVDI